MRYHKTDLHLIVVDFESLAEDIQNSYLTKLRSEFQIFPDDLPKKDASRLLVYYIIQHVLEIQVKFKEHKKNIIFYINEKLNTYKDIKFNFKRVANALNLIVYTNILDYDCIHSKSGESIELNNSITNYRFNFDHNKYSHKKLLVCLKKHKISPDILNRYK
jgi:hypothetical protein